MSRRCRQSLQDTFTDDKDPLEASGSSGCRCRQTVSGTGAACENPIIYDSNVLIDPGLELLEPEYTNTLEIPTWDSVNRVYTFKNSTGLPDLGKDPVIPWSQNAVEFDNRWILNKTEQRTGDYCAQGGVGTGGPNYIIPHTQFTCLTTGSGPGLVGQTARVEQGDLVTASIFAKHISGTTAFAIQFRWLPKKIAGSLTGSENEFDVTTSYVRYTASSFAPATAYWNEIRFDGRPGTGGPILYLDDAEVVVNRAGSGVLLCAFASLITIDNSTTETSFL